MRRTWTQIKNATMTRSEQRQARIIATRDLADMELSELREALRPRQGDLAKKHRVKRD